MGYPMPRNAPEQYWMPGMQSYENAPWWKWNSSTGEWRCAACDKNFQNDLHLDNKEHGRRWYNWCVVYKNLPDMEIHHRWVRKNPDFKWGPTPPSDEEAFKGKGKKGKGKDGGRGQENSGQGGQEDEVQDFQVGSEVSSIAAEGGAEAGGRRFGQWASRADQALVSEPLWAQQEPQTTAAAAADDGSSSTAPTQQQRETTAPTATAAADDGSSSMAPTQQQPQTTGMVSKAKAPPPQQATRSKASAPPRLRLSAEAPDLDAQAPRSVACGRDADHFHVK